jgi:hypothetical protein
MQRFFELVEVSIENIFVFNAPLETIVVLLFYILHFFTWRILPMFWEGQENK